MSYKRVPGGEKTEKTGIAWNKQELEAVYYLFQEINGEGIHERNPKIHELSNQIGRSIRSIEAQLLMFRALEKNYNYSHKNMSSLSKLIWEEKSAFNEDGAKYDLNVKAENIIYPHDLLAWAGHKKGGVKTPFLNNSGRPVGEVIETKLVRKLKQWVIDISEKRSVPRILLLVGGPGNGKTDALEFFIQYLDDIINQKTKLYDKFTDIFHNSTPRKASTGLENLNVGFDTIHIVPDASVGESGLSKEECLVNDLKNCIANKNVIYISCVNRGIIANAAEYAEKNNETISEFLNQISSYISQDNNNSSLWPLEENKDIALWPMDIESLVETDKSIDGHHLTPMHLILDKVLDESKWINCKTCAATELCPFYINKVDLTNNTAKNNLIDILRRFEIMSGKRLTFRDVFSLIPYILIGNEDDFNNSSPCNWVINHLNEIEKNQKSIKSIFELSSHLYPHRLFSIWPKMTILSKGKRFKEIFIFLKETQTDQLFRILAYGKKDDNTYISNLLRTQFSQLLDPANLSGTNIKIESVEKSISEIEDLFSNSIGSGFSNVIMGLNNLEIAFIKTMSNIEIDLINSEIPKNLITQRDFIVNIHKTFICKFVKRSLGVKNGLTNDDEFIREYVNLVDGKNHKELKKYQKLFKKLLNPNESFIVSLSNTFGQPKSEHSKNIFLKANSIPVKLDLSPHNLDNVPRVNLPYFEILNKRTPLSYELFKALMKIDKGINQASLSNEVMAMIDSLVSKIGGVIVRDSAYLSNASIRIGNIPIEIILDGGDINAIEINALKN